MNEDTITVTLDGDEVLCLAQLIVARMQYLAEQPPALEVLAEVEILGRYLKKNRATGLSPRSTGATGTEEPLELGEWYA